jgi:hypothetical protein
MMSIVIWSSIREGEMKRTLCGLLTVSSFLLVTLSTASAQQSMLTDKQLLDEMQDAAPAEVVKNATIMNMGADGKMTTVQTGTNGWTCMDPGGAPTRARWSGPRPAKTRDPLRSRWGSSIC